MFVKAKVFLPEFEHQIYFHNKKFETTLEILLILVQRISKSRSTALKNVNYINKSIYVKIDDHLIAII